MTDSVLNFRHRFPRLAGTFCAALICASAGAVDDSSALTVGPESTAPAGPALAASQDADVAELRALSAETVAAMQQAQAGFNEGVVSDESAALQSGILDRLRRLAELVRRQSQMMSAGQTSSPGARGAQASDAGDGQGAAGRNPDAAESSEAATPEATGELAPTPPTRDLATSVWGHLPARQRDRMQSRFSERFLPQYEDLVRQYYEALATDGPPQK